MDVRRTVSVGVLLLLIPSIAICQPDGKKLDQPAQMHAHKRDDSFLEYTLKQVNPTDVDYGSRGARWRKAFVERTLANRYFWSNTIALVLLAGLSLAMLYQRNSQTRRDWATADVLAQYEHALTRANVQIQDLTSKNHALAGAIAEKKEQARQSSFAPPLPREQSPATGATNPERPRIEPSRTAVSKEAQRTQKHLQATENDNQITLFTPEVDLMMTVNSLKQQLAHSEEKNTLLQRRIASTNRDRESRQNLPVRNLWASIRQRQNKRSTNDGNRETT
jgi:hypothetical protein